MSQEGSIAPGQASRLITAERKRAMAEERARILGRRRPPPSAIEEAAVRWEREREARARKAEEERREFSRQQEAPPFSLQQVSILHQGIEANGEPGWKVLVSTQDSGTRMAHGVNRRGVGALFRRLMAIERARILSRKPQLSWGVTGLEHKTRWTQDLRQDPGCPVMGISVLAVPRVTNTLNMEVPSKW